MNLVRTPSSNNIGLDGSRAAWLISQHSQLQIMAFMLKKFEYLYRKDKETVFYQGIPFLKDRLRILGHKAQLYGTQRFSRPDGSEAIFPIRGFYNLNYRRKQYGLAPLHLKANGVWPQQGSTNE